MNYDDKYRPHISTGGGMTQGYRYIICPECGRHGVSSRIIDHKPTIRKVCRYCGWIEK